MQLDFLETHPLIRSLDAYRIEPAPKHQPTPKPMTQLQTTLRQLRLSGLSQTLDVRLQEAAAGRLGHGLFEGDRDAAKSWLSAPQKALGGEVPLTIARTELGALEVERAIGRLEHGVFT